MRRTPAARPILVVFGVVGVFGLTGLLAACGDSEPVPTSSELVVCETIQTIVDDLAAQRNTSALATLPALELAVLATDNEQFAEAGKAFFDDLFTDIDYTQLTIDQTAELGQKYQETMARSLGSMIDECAEVGAPLERLPAQ